MRKSYRIRVQRGRIVEYKHIEVNVPSSVVGTTREPAYVLREAGYEDASIPDFEEDMERAHWIGKKLLRLSEMRGYWSDDGSDLIVCDRDSGVELAKAALTIPEGIPVRAVALLDFVDLKEIRSRLLCVFSKEIGMGILVQLTVNGEKKEVCVPSGMEGTTEEPQHVLTFLEDEEAVVDEYEEVYRKLIPLVEKAAKSAGLEGSWDEFKYPSSFVVPGVGQFTFHFDGSILNGEFFKDNIPLAEKNRIFSAFSKSLDEIRNPTPPTEEN